MTLQYSTWTNSTSTRCRTRRNIKKLFLGKYLKQLPVPCVVVDQSIVKAHCKQMLNACKARDVWLRTYIKTYKSCSCY